MYSFAKKLGLFMYLFGVGKAFPEGSDTQAVCEGSYAQAQSKSTGGGGGEAIRMLFIYFFSPNGHPMVCSNST